MDDFVMILWSLALGFFLGLSVALSPKWVVSVNGADGKVLTVEYENKVYKLVLLEE